MDARDQLGPEIAERFWDDAAPYEGKNLYARGTGAYVSGGIAAAIQFKMREGDQCDARGVMLMTDGRVYTWTCRAERHADLNGRRRLATFMRSGTFADHARGLFEFERTRIDPELMDHYRAQLAAL